jgi:hypothetical protein
MLKLKPNTRSVWCNDSLYVYAWHRVNISLKIWKNLFRKLSLHSLNLFLFSWHIDWLSNIRANRRPGTGDMSTLQSAFETWNARGLNKHNDEAIHIGFALIQQNGLLYFGQSAQAFRYSRSNRFKINLRAQKTNHVINEVYKITKQALLYELQMRTSYGNDHYKSSNRPPKPVTISWE